MSLPKQEFPNSTGRPDTLLAADHLVGSNELVVHEIPLGAYLTGPIFQVKASTVIFTVSAIGTAPFTTWVATPEDSTDIFIPAGTEVFLEVTQKAFAALWSPAFVTRSFEGDRLPNASALEDISLAELGTRSHTDLSDVNPDDHHSEYHNHSNGVTGDSLFPLSLVVGGTLKVDSIHLALITVDQNDYQQSFSIAPQYTTWYLSSDASHNITGVYGNQQLDEGRVLILVNEGTHNLVLKHESSSSAAANRIRCPGGSDFTVAPDTIAMLFWDLSISRWRVK